MVIKRNREPAASAAATSTSSTTPTTAAPTCPTSPWSPPSSPPPGDRTTDIWFYVAVARAPRRDRRRVAGIHAGHQHPGRGGGGADRQLAAGRGRPARRPRRSSCWRPPSTRPATRPPTSPTCAPRSPPTRRASPNCTRWWTFRPGRGAAYMGHVQENAAESVRRVITALHDGEFCYELDNGAGSRSRSGSTGRTGPPRSTSPAPRRSCPATSTRLQRGHGGRALRLPHPGRRRHPAQLGLPAAAHRDHPAGHDALPAVPGRGRGGQRGDLSGRHRGAVRGPGRDGGGVRDDEQRDVRQRQVPVLRDGGQRLGRGRRLRRHRRGADQDDQLPAHRPRGARVALPGAARVLPDQAGQRRPGPLARRPRRRPQAPLRRADDRHHADRPPPRPGVRPGRRRAGRARPALDRAPRTAR